MFMNLKHITTTQSDHLGVVVASKTTSIYLMDGQVQNSKTLHPSIQRLYKKIYIRQEEETLLQDRPVTVFEVLDLLKKELDFNYGSEASEVSEGSGVSEVSDGSGVSEMKIPEVQPTSPSRPIKPIKSSKPPINTK